MASGFMRNVRNNLLAGLAVMAPVGVTIYAFNVLFGSIDAIFGPHLNRLLEYFFPTAFPQARIPGLGIVATVALLYVAGSLARSYVGGQLLAAWEAFITRVPVFGGINKAAKQVMGAIAKPGGGGFRRVVLVRVKDPESYVIGFVTGTSKVEGEEEPRKHVFIPTAPNPTTGILALMRQEELVDSDLSVEEAMKLIVSAGLVEGQADDEPAPKA
ncbi:DUF502 domain-containing protein [Myxococcota bacterium]|nr:DUF502 domain-containing protein [Myxococcota bacterium]